MKRFLAVKPGANTMQLLHKEFVATEQGPHLLITGGVHGDEFEPMAAIRRLIRHFEDAAPSSKLTRGRLTLVPVVNEAAYLRAARTAEDNLDLARICPGGPDGSVTERTANALSELIRGADCYIDLHTGGTAFSVSPMVGYGLHSDGQLLEQQRRMARAFNLPIIWGTCGTLNGRSLSVARDARVPAIYTEFHGSGNCDPRGVEAYFDGCLNVMAMLEMIDRPVQASEAKYVIEDPRPGSGHMQVCNPSPITGFFEPAVELGQEIKSGDLIGTVCDMLGTTVHEVRSDQNGIVLTLRTFLRVMKGDSVGVVLETAGSPQ